MIPSKRDDNEAELVALWRQIGAVVIPMGREAGFDLIVAHRGEVYIVEIKDIKAGHKKYYLTDAERSVCAALGAVDVVYSIVTNRQEALELIGVQ